MYQPIQHIHNQAPALIASPVPSVLENKPVPRLGLKHLRLHIDIPTEVNVSPELVYLKQIKR